MSRLDDINQSYQDYQDFLEVREKRLKLPAAFDPSDLDEVLSLLRDSTPDLTVKKG